jgi:hypothetical protein
MVLEGYISREENEWDRTRNIMAFIATFSGMGAKKAVDPTEIMPLYKDLLEKIKPIRTYKEAMDLLESFNEVL